MKKAFYSFIYYRLLGWKTNVTVPDYDKCVICAAPHTSNWDLFIGKLFYGAIGRKTSFMMKKEWFFFPLGLIFKAVGGIPVNRGRKSSLVDQMTEKFANSKHFHLAITPEGTRKANPNWKKGFYYIALKAQVPIMLIGIDYPSKTISSTKAVMPTGDIEKDNAALDAYFLSLPNAGSFRRVYVNCDNNLLNLRRNGESWQVVLIDEEMKKRMFEDAE